MYSRFLLKASTLKSFIDQYEEDQSLPIFDISKGKESVYKKLSFFVDSSGVIDGGKLQSYTFPMGEQDKYDVFISYSHNDIELATKLSSYLQNCCKLKVFLDYYVWKSADGLLKKIDDKYCKSKDKVHYIYGRRNFSTSHVHAMLSMALLDIIDNTECCIFLDSNHSIHLSDLKNTNKARTLSPWIYEELSFMRYLPKKRERDMRCSDSIKKIDEGQLSISHTVDLVEFMVMDEQDLHLMQQYCSTSALDAIYDKHNYRVDEV